MRSYSDYIINVKNLKHNISLFRRLISDDVKLCAVVKADAYGLGVKTICENVAEYVDYFAVSNISEAKEIREYGFKENILILGSVPLSEIGTCVQNNIEISVYSLDYLKALIKVLEYRPITIHLKLNTGLNRYGIKDVLELKEAIELINNSENITLRGVFTHFATKSNDIEFIRTQKNIFDNMVSLLPSGIIKHCANSFASVYSETLHMDMIRVGANMYGDIRSEGLPLKDVLSIHSQIVAINSVKKGQSVGYDKTFTALRNSKIAVVPLGYADGISRRASNMMYVLINGKKVKIVGNVCMDALMIDVTGMDVYVGSMVVILGESQDNKLSLNDWAKVLNTSSYEILLNFRYKRMNYKLIK